MLRFTSFNAPARFVFKDPDTGREFEAATKQELVTRIVNYRAQNQLEPIKHLDVVLADYWCRCEENRGKCEKFKLSRGWIATFKGGVNILKNIFFGEEKMVDEFEAERRAGICAGCPKNVFPDRGPFLQWSDEIAIASTGGRKTSKDSELGNCVVCSCPLRALVHARDLEVKPDEEYPDFCWKINR